MTQSATRTRVSSIGSGHLARIARGFKKTGWTTGKGLVSGWSCMCGRTRKIRSGGDDDIDLTSKLGRSTLLYFI
jgi:hypothetical protein